ncbi:MAG: hypothetical protein IT324_08700, partial [Anaerolineae bacterium]|nr:hypothetical protein [Anaerolineae bacterium]
MQKKASILCVLLLAILGSLASLGRGATQAQPLQQSATPPSAIDLGGSLGLVDAQDRNIRISAKYPTGWRGLRNIERTAAAMAPSADALSGKLQRGQVLLGVTAGRYAINSTYGIQGNIDPASALSVLQVITAERFRNATVGTITEKTFGGNPGAVVAITDARNFGSYISPVQALADYYLVAVIINGYPVVLSATALPGEGAQFHGLLEAMADTVTVTVNVASATPIRPTRTATSVATSGADSSPPRPTLADG